MMHQAADEMIAELRHAELALLILEQVGLAGIVPHRQMHVAAVAGQVDERLRHEGGTEPVLLGDRLHHELEECQLVGGCQRVVEIPVDLELPVGIFMVVLIRPPAKLHHGGRDLGDDIEAPHDGGLIVARLVGRIAAVGDRRAVGVDEMELRLHTCHQLHALGRIFLGELAQHDAGGLRQGLAIHPRIACHPCDFRPPRQRDDGIGIGHHQNVRMRRCLVEPGGEPREPRSRLLHPLGGFRRHQLRPLHAEQVGEVEEEELDTMFFGVSGEIAHDVSVSCPGL